MSAMHYVSVCVSVNKRPMVQCSFELWSNESLCSHLNEAYIIIESKTVLI